MHISRDDFPDTTPVTPIEVDSALGVGIGLYSKVFVPSGQCSEDYSVGTQLFRSGEFMYIQAVEIWAGERKKGHFKRLLETLTGLGFGIKVPNPIKPLEIWLKKMRFYQIDEPHPYTHELEVVLVKDAV